MAVVNITTQVLRTDFFWGWGQEAGERAGRMRDDAEVFVLLPRPTEVAAAPETR